MTIDAILVGTGVGFLIPLANAIVTKANASPAVKSVVGCALAGLTAVGAWVANVEGVVTVKQIGAVALAAIISAGGALASTWLDTAKAKIESSIPGGIG
jgi:hypothetical protein